MPTWRQSRRYPRPCSRCSDRTWPTWPPGNRLPEPGTISKGCIKLGSHSAACARRCPSFVRCSRSRKPRPGRTGCGIWQLALAGPGIWMCLFPRPWPGCAARFRWQVLASWRQWPSSIVPKPIRKCGPCWIATLTSSSSKISAIGWKTGVGTRGNSATSSATSWKEM